MTDRPNNRLTDTRVDTQVTFQITFGSTQVFLPLHVTQQTITGFLHADV